MNKKNIIALAVLAGLVVILLAVMIFMSSSFFKEKKEEEVVPTDDINFVLDGERIYKKDLARSDVAKIFVHNPDGEFAFVRNNEGEFVIEGMEELAYNETLFAALFTVTCNPRSMTTVVNDASGYDEYGITDSDTYWEVTAVNGEVYRMTVGHMLHTGGGYYVSYADRDAVYVIGGGGEMFAQVLELEEKEATSVDITVRKTIEFFVSPMLIAGIDSNDFYLMKDFSILRDGEVFISTEIVDKEEQLNPNAIVENRLVYPAKYYTNDDNYYEVLQNLAALTGVSTVKAGVEDKDLEEFGLAKPAYSIHFKYNDLNYMIMASEMQEDGSYYAYSTFNPNIIAKVSAEKLGFLEEDLIYWISPQPFNRNITDISKISVSGKGTDLVFYLGHGIDSKGNATLVVDAQNKLTGEAINIATANHVWDFRSAYRTVLYTNIEEEVPLTAEEKAALTADKENLILTFEFTLKNGEVETLQFWQYSTRRTLLTINGKGDYYVYLDRANKILSDFGMVWRGEVVDSHAKN